jgi:ketosteroid isomerase-like protein
MREPVDVVLASNAALNRRDVPAMLANYAPDATVDDHRQVSLGSFRGHDQLHALYSGLVGAAAEFTERVAFLAVDGGVVVAACEVQARLADDATGRLIGAEYGYVATVREDRIASLVLFDDGAAALAASGLEPAG